MGLIGAWLGSLYHGMPVTIMSPLTFLTRPERWLWAMHYHRATISAAPNFAYELCARRVADSSIEGPDLSSVRLLLNGAEAVSPATLRRFSAKFKKYGLSPQSFYPVYGLAESSLAVAFPDAREGPVIDRIRRGEYERERRAVPAGERDKNFLEFACCGKALPGHEIRIVDDEGKPAGERRIGHLQFRGPSCMQGYYRNPGATAEIYRDGWWESGDMAYMDGKGVYITGRIKDMIIKAGRNIYPPEVEDVAGSVEGVRTGCVVSFGVGDAERGTEDLVIVAESSERSAGARDRIVAEITGRVSGAIGLPPDRVVLVPPRTIKKTSSGKLRRSECREDFLKGRLGVRARPAWFQVASLYAKSGIIKLTALAGISGRGVYTLYAAALACVLGAPLIAVLFAMPAGMSRAVGKLYARSLFLLLACPLFVKGRENLNAGGGAVYVINHSSYLDTIVCTAALPAGTLFVGKRELFESFLPGVFLRKLGHIPIEREDFDASVASVNGVTRALLDGNSLALFAEGTFTYAAGLRPFKLGAFKAAAEAGVPVFPVAMRGTRAMLRDGSVLLRPGVISIRIGEPVMPEGAGWESIVSLRDRVRAEIAKHCGEPTIDLVRAGHGS
jgi:1-acyl-sn-glycerol-3-phosphate acyltransferase